MLIKIINQLLSNKVSDMSCHHLMVVELGETVNC